MESVRWVLLLATALAGCSAGPAPAARPKPLRDFRGIIHCHSLYSHDSKGTYEEILAAAKAARVDFVIMTDHPPKDDPGRPLREGWRGLHDGVLFIQGAELAGSNLLAIGIREPIHAAGVPAKIDAIHAQGGLAIVSHCEEVSDWEPYAAADGMEIYNVHAALKAKRKDPRFLAEVLKALKEDPEGSFRLLQELDPAILAKWDDLNRTRRFVGIAGNDAHQNVNFMGLQLDPYERAFKFVSTCVRAEELAEEAILAGLRQGRCYVAFGDVRLPWTFLLVNQRAERYRARVYVDGALREEIPGMRGESAMGPGRRVEWWTAGPEGMRPAALANPGLTPSGR